MKYTPVKNHAPRIAIVEDDPDLRVNLEGYLAAQGYAVWGVDSAEAFYKRYLRDEVDVVILDIELPGEDGISVAQHLREIPQITVIIVSARNTLDDRIAGLNAGADRYLVKPIDFLELIANLETITRRRHVLPPATPLPPVLSAAPNDWQLLKHGWKLIAPSGAILPLTSCEFIFLQCLFDASGEVVAKKILYAALFENYAMNKAQRLDAILARLRKKCLSELGKSLPVKTAHQVGYVFTAPMRRDTTLTQNDNSMR